MTTDPEPLTDIERVTKALRIGASCFDGDSWYAFNDGLGSYDELEADMKAGWEALNRLDAARAAAPSDPEDDRGNGESDGGRVEPAAAPSDGLREALTRAVESCYASKMPEAVMRSPEAVVVHMREVLQGVLATTEQREGLTQVCEAGRHEFGPCTRCGKPGTLFVAILTPDERATIEPIR